MKRLSILLLSMLCTAATTFAYDFQSGDLYYNITSENTVEVTYKYRSWEGTNYQGLTTATIPETVTYNGTTYSVTSIGDNAFSSCSSLTSITIPNSVTVIGDNAFDGCSSLTSITIPNSVTSIGDYAFWSVPNIVYYGTATGSPWGAKSVNGYVDGFFVYADETKTTLLACSGAATGEITIPESVTVIGDNAFAYCFSLTSISIPNSVTSIGDYAFYECSSLTSITIPNSVTSIGSSAFSGCSSLPVVDNLRYADTYLVEAVDKSLSTYIIKEGTKWIGDRAFSGCSSLTSITIPNSVTSIGDNAFSSCSSLTSITIPNSVTSIGYEAFAYCSSLTSITIPNSVTSIGDYAFYECSSLTSITIPNSVTSIGLAAFIGCSSLTSIIIPNSVTSIGYYAFSGCSSLTSITIPNSVTSIGERAFAYVPNVVYNGTATGSPWGAKSVNGYVDGYFVYADETKTTLLACSGVASGEIAIPESVTVIGDNAFAYCFSLTSISIPNSVTSIGDYAFYSCKSLTSITLPNSVTSIGDYAFYECSSLTSITIPNSVTSIGRYAFYECSSLTSITLPNSVTSIGKEAFKGCSSLTSVVWNAKNCDVTEWKTSSSYYYGPFANISSQITSFIIGSEVDSIPDYLCYGMSSLTSVTIPNSVTSIGKSAFENCSALTSVTSCACNPPVCGNSVFYKTPSKKTLIVPSISLASYKNSSTWKTFTSLESIVYPSITVQSSDSTLGVAQIEQDVDCDSVAIIAATPNIGYHFTQWTDGNTDNPRTIKLTQDTTFTAEFAMDYSGKCGDDLYWAYSNKEVKVTGTGAMYNYTDSTMPWTLLRDSILSVHVANTATSIGVCAFPNTRRLATLHIGADIEDIGANAFAGCTRLYDIYCYPTYPPFAESNSFANYNVTIYVPCNVQEDYARDIVWGEFKYIECIGSEDVVVPDNEVTISPNYEDASFTWPVTDGADTYALVITKDDITFCTLVFNAQGQLVSIAFKPSRQNAPAEEGTTPATYAEMTANGFRFTVTGLDEGTDYVYTLTVRNAANSVLETYTGEFTTLSNTPTGVLESAGEDACAPGQAEKILRDGQVLIIRNGVTYDMMGQRL